LKLNDIFGNVELSAFHVKKHLGRDHGQNLCYCAATLHYREKPGMIFRPSFRKSGQFLNLLARQEKGACLMTGSYEYGFDKTPGFMYGSTYVPARKIEVSKCFPAEVRSKDYKKRLADVAGVRGGWHEYYKMYTEAGIEYIDGRNGQKHGKAIGFVPAKGVYIHTTYENGEYTPMRKASEY